MSFTVSDYFYSLESRVGYNLLLGGTRHFGYYDEGAYWPFPIGKALRRMEEYLYKTLGLKNDALLLDAGTGNGDVAVYLAKKGLRIKAIDLLDKHVRQARSNVKCAEEKGKIECQVYHGNFENLEFDNEEFDGVYTVETLVHSAHPDQAIQEFYRVLKPGGVITHAEYEHDMANCPAGQSVFTQINTYAHLPAFQQFKLGTIRTKLEKVGFREVEIQDLSLNVAPMMRLFFLLAYLPYLVIKLLNLEAYFVNTMAAVETWRYGKHIRYLMVKGRKPFYTPSGSINVRPKGYTRQET